MAQNHWAANIKVKPTQLPADSTKTSENNSLQNIYGKSINTILEPMQLALKLALEGCGTTSPNPSVGAIITKDGITVILTLIHI